MSYGPRGFHLLPLGRCAAVPVAIPGATPVAADVGAPSWVHPPGIILGTSLGAWWLGGLADWLVDA